MDIKIESPVLPCHPPEGTTRVAIKFMYYPPADRHCFVMRWYDEDGNKLATEGLWTDEPLEVKPVS